jgi:hypothetical protein
LQYFLNVSNFALNINEEELNFTGTDKNNEGLIFIKPFEVVSSYGAFVETWEVANKKLKEIEEVNSVSLMQSLYEEARFGYISYSYWKNKESFIKSVKQHPVLKYHNMFYGGSTNSAPLTLYREISTEIFKYKNKKENITEIMLMETELEYDEKIMEYWHIFFESALNSEGLLSSSLYKSVYKKNKFRYIGFLNLEDIDSFRRKFENPFRLKIEGENKGFKIYSSVYNVAKKIKRTSNNPKILNKDFVLK